MQIILAREDDLELVHHLCFKNKWFGDGIFDVVLVMYYQLYTIHC